MGKSKVAKALFMTEQELIELYGEGVSEVIKDMEPTAQYVVDKKPTPMYSPDRVRARLND